MVLDVFCTIYLWTQDIHKTLESKLSGFWVPRIPYCTQLLMPMAVFLNLYLANGMQLFQTNWIMPSIIDGVRLCKRWISIFAQMTWALLNKNCGRLIPARARREIIVTDGAFGMDGTIAQLDKILHLADRYEGISNDWWAPYQRFLGKTGQGSHEMKGVIGRIDIITGNFRERPRRRFRQGLPPIVRK